MGGGRLRLARYFGTTLAAAYQRLIDRSRFDHDFVVATPESLFTPQPVLDWIAANREIDADVERQFDPEVVRDADRFFAAVGTLAP
jgi:hypothetical protein